MQVTALQLDTSSLASVREAAARCRAMMHRGEVDTLQAILCNAGARIEAVSYTPDSYEETFETNHLGHFLLIELLIDCMAENGRVVFTASGTHDPQTMDGKLVGAVVEPNALHWRMMAKMAESQPRPERDIQHGEGTVLNPTLRCDYGYNITIGDRTFVNYDCALVDCNRITIGDEVLIAPGVHVYTATHPVEAQVRRSGLEYALPISIEDGVWLGGRSIVCPGVTIGANTVVGAGSVVTRDLPANVVAVGCPCRVIRHL